MPDGKGWQSRNPRIRHGAALNEVTRAAELAARASYGRILSILSARSGDIALAEDSLAEAFARALITWPKRGVPKNPDAWLMRVARNQITDRQRHMTRFPTEQELPDLPEQNNQPTDYPDERLALLMVCAHPAISPDLHTPMMLQTVLGLEAKTIAQLFMVSPTALAKRLVRAKQKIRSAGIAFQIPDPEFLPERSQAIYEAIYAVHAQDWLQPGDRLGDEALYLADLLVKLMPDQPEAFGLSALVAFGHARSNARIADGVLVPVEKQDVRFWDDQLLDYGIRQLRTARQFNSIGRFQLEAAIQSVHLDRKNTGTTNWGALNKLYFALIKDNPSTGAMVAQAVVTSHLHGAEAGLTALGQIETDGSFQPLWAARAEFLNRQGKNKIAKQAYEKAISLTTEMPLRRFLQAQMAALQKRN